MINNLQMKLDHLLCSGFISYFTFWNQSLHCFPPFEMIGAIHLFKLPQMRGVNASYTVETLPNISHFFSFHGFVSVLSVLSLFLYLCLCLPPSLRIHLLNGVLSRHFKSTKSLCHVQVLAFDSGRAAHKAHVDGSSQLLFPVVVPPEFQPLRIRLVSAQALGCFDSCLSGFGSV